MASGFAITIRDLRRNFGDVKAVDGINIDIPSIGVFGLLGPNGAGKSTTIHLICGLLKPSSGDIQFRGRSISTMKSRIGYCPQENNFYPKLTCFEQLSFMGIVHGLSKKQSNDRSKELIDLLGLGSKSSSLAIKLSGGMKRRLTLALAIIHMPEILVLDEPETGLDPQSRVMVRQFISDYAESNCVLLSTHNMDEADRLCSSVAIIDKGKILACDSPAQLKKTLGEGDSLELQLENHSLTQDQSSLLVEKLIERVEAPTIHIIDSVVWIRAKNVLNLIPGILDCCHHVGVMVSEIRLRENTLEDVFITLTGKSLRQ